MFDYVNISQPNDYLGDPLRNAYHIINENFTKILNEYPDNESVAASINYLQEQINNIGDIQKIGDIQSIIDQLTIIMAELNANQIIQMAAHEQLTSPDRIVIPVLINGEPYPIRYSIDGVMNEISTEINVNIPALSNSNNNRIDYLLLKDGNTYEYRVGQEGTGAVVPPAKLSTELLAVPIHINKGTISTTSPSANRTAYSLSLVGGNNTIPTAYKNKKDYLINSSQPGAILTGMDREVAWEQFQFAASFNPTQKSVVLSNSFSQYEIITIQNNTNEDVEILHSATTLAAVIRFRFTNGENYTLKPQEIIRFYSRGKYLYFLSTNRLYKGGTGVIVQDDVISADLPDMDEFLTKVEAMNDYATITYVDDQINSLPSPGGGAGNCELKFVDVIMDHTVIYDLHNTPYTVPLTGILPTDRIIIHPEQCHFVLNTDGYFMNQPPLAIEPVLQIGFIDFDTLFKEYCSLEIPLDIKEEISWTSAFTVRNAPITPNNNIAIKMETPMTSENENTGRIKIRIYYTKSNIYTL